MKIKRGDGLNIVPFIDVMLVLLALVLSISTFISQGKIKVDIPVASSSQQDKNDDKPFLIVIDNQNKIYVDDKEVSKDNLASLIQNIPNDRMVSFKGDKDSSLDSLVFVIDQLTKKGHEHDKFRIDTQRH
ncbi:TonB system transport protein ExbD [Helicobacter aurati]|uniref:Biopolymer transport protein ExbD n=1 Tax=Helicobacter aurati TaxID=137778 RepID=A0A3D8IZ40_9HELI|nr:TonB system transport protein ExbD [Helicobacter aurati]RDU70256.1 TonB system transport protein ExbD [Helicobacter aurati]